jgi:hypothetical protein
LGQFEKNASIEGHQIKIETMLKKIISGGQTEADQAVLDVAIAFGIPHGGWTTKGRISNIRPRLGKYHLQEMLTDNYSDCIKQNVIDANGTLIISYGRLTGDLDYARRMTLGHRRQMLGIDLMQSALFKAASLLNDWIQLYRIKILFVIGPGATVNPDVGKHTKLIVEGALLFDPTGSKTISLASDNTKGHQYLGTLPVQPKTIDEAVDRLILELSFKEQTKIANMSESALITFHISYGVYIRNEFRLWGNDSLLAFCKAYAGVNDINPEQASYIIVKELWERLQNANVLKVIK